MKTITVLLLVGIVFGPGASAFKLPSLQQNLEIEWVAPTGKKYNLDLHQPETGVLHPNLKYLTVQADKETGRLYTTDRSPSPKELKQAENIHIDYENRAVLKISKSKDDTHSMEGLLDGHFIKKSTGHTSFVKLDSNYQSDYVNTNATLTYLNMQRNVPQNSQDYIVELAILVDKELADQFQHDRQRIIEYWAVYFWDINMRYKTLPSSNISFRITSIIVIASFEAQPFIENTRNDEGVANIGGILGQFGYWMFENSAIFPKYDMAMCVTNTKMNGYGLAYVYGACRPILNSLVYADHGGYNGIEAAAHEIGHNLGAPHDADANFPGGCSSDGFIMSGNRGIGKHFFSECSDRAIKTYVTSDQAACLQRIDEPADPVVDPQERVEYPPTIDEQCKALRGNRSAEVGEADKTNYNCAETLCWWGNNAIWIRPVDNTPCRYGRCFRTRCLPDGSVLKNVQSGECILGKNRFSGNDDAIMGQCPRAPTPLEKFYANKTTNGNLLMMPYSTQEATENEDKCLQISGENDNLVKFVRCAHKGQGKHEWQLVAVADGIYLIKEIQTQRCLKQDGTAIAAVTQCNENDQKSLWYYEISDEVY